MEYVLILIFIAVAAFISLLAIAAVNVMYTEDRYGHIVRRGKK